MQTQPSLSPLRNDPMPQGYFVGCRENAEAAMDKAAETMVRLSKARRRLSGKNAGNANRLNDFVREARGWLANAEKFLEYAGRGS